MTDTLAAERARLAKRLTELDDERGKITYALSILDNIANAQSSSAAPDVSQATDRRTPTRASGGTYEFAVRAIEALGEPARVEQVFEKMQELGWETGATNKLDAARAALSRAARDKTIAKPSFGLYGPLQPSTRNEASSAPVAGDADGAELDESLGRPPVGAPYELAHSSSGISGVEQTA